MSEYKNSHILEAFYDAIGKNLAGKQEAGQSCARFFKFKFGYGYINNDVEPPALEEIPSDLEEIPNVFFEREFQSSDITYENGRMILKCMMPIGGVAIAHRYSLTGLYDQNDNLLAVMQDLPDWLTPEDEHTSYGYIDFPHIGSNPPTAI